MSKLSRLALGVLLCAVLIASPSRAQSIDDLVKKKFGETELALIVSAARLADAATQIAERDAKVTALTKRVSDLEAQIKDMQEKQQPSPGE